MDPEGGRGRGALGAEAPTSMLVNDIHKYHLYIPSVYCTDDTVRARHKNHVTYLTCSLTLYHECI